MKIQFTSHIHPIFIIFGKHYPTAQQYFLNGHLIFGY